MKVRATSHTVKNRDESSGCLTHGEQCVSSRRVLDEDELEAEAVGSTSGNYGMKLYDKDTN